MLVLLLLIITLTFVIYYIKQRRENVPKIVHQIYIQGKDKLPIFVKNVIEQNKKENPEYTFMFYDYDDIKRYVYQNTNKKIIKCFEKINPECYTCISDFFRYIIVYNEGGIYLDVKIKINTPLNQWLMGNKIHIGVWLWHDYMELDEYYDIDHKPKGNKKQLLQSVFMFSKRHPLLEGVIDDMCHQINYNKSNDILEITGPNMYTKSIAPKLKYYNYSIYEEDGQLYNNNITFDGTHGKYYEYMNNNKLHWSKKKDRVLI